MPPKSKKSSGARGLATRWTEQQVKLLTDAVAASPTAKQAFEKVAKELGKSPGTVQQKWYGLQRATGGVGSRVAAASGAAKRSGSSPRQASGQDLRVMPIDELTALARQVKTEIDRRKRELENASQLFS